MKTVIIQTSLYSAFGIYDRSGLEVDKPFWSSFAHVDIQVLLHGPNSQLECDFLLPLASAASLH